MRMINTGYGPDATSDRADNGINNKFGAKLFSG